MGFKITLTRSSHQTIYYISAKHFVLLIEVKSTHDKATIKENLEVTADSKIIKNNKRSAQHQLRDHIEMLQNGLGYDIDREIQCYIMWPFLGQYTKDPKQQVSGQLFLVTIYKNILYIQGDQNPIFLGGFGYFQRPPLQNDVPFSKVR